MVAEVKVVPQLGKDGGIAKEQKPLQAVDVLTLLIVLAFHGYMHVCLSTLQIWAVYSCRLYVTKATKIISSTKR